MKNNVTRLLEARGIPYTAFELPAEKLSAVEAAQYLDVDPELVYKTIVVLRAGRGNPILAVVPGPLEVDVKALAKAVGERKLVLATQRQAEQVTGLLTGGISPLALLNRGFEIWIDPAARAHERIYVNAGQRGINLELRVDDLVRVTGARWFERA